MSLFDFLFPQQASASHLRGIRHQLDANAKADSIRRRKDAQRTSEEISAATDELSDEVGEVALLLVGAIRAMIRKGLVTRAEVFAEMFEADDTDGDRDAKLKPLVMNDALNVRPNESQDS